MFENFSIQFHEYQRKEFSLPNKEYNFIGKFGRKDEILLNNSLKNAWNSLQMENFKKSGESISLKVLQ